VVQKEALQKIFHDMNNLHVVVLGDVMLDNYWWGDVERISPEAPVPVVALRKRESRLGGAANVALNCVALGAKVTLASIVGDDADGILLSNLAKDAGMNTSLIMPSKHRPTTTKTRVICRHQQMLRLDEEVIDDLCVEEEHPFIDMVLRYLQLHKPDVLIFEDYNKGLLKENLIKRVTNHCRETGTITAVDPKKKNFLAYKNVDIFKPNLKEVREGIHLPIENVSLTEMNQAEEKLRTALHHQVTFITLSEKGVFYNDGQHHEIIPSHMRNIADVSGAGDTVIATASLIYALTKDARLMAAVSNIAGGLVCEQIGVVPIEKTLLLKECEGLIGV
jgi:rfaE bifunctional protein kinase chain/domain